MTQSRPFCVLTAAVLATTMASSAASAATIVSVVSGPQDGGPNIARLVDSSFPNYGDFGLHDHVVIAPYIPDPDRNYVIFTFDEAVVVTGLTMLQHANGITSLDISAGTSTSTLLHTATATSSYGLITGDSAFPDTGSDIFSFSNSSTGLVQKFIVSSTSNPGGYASYRWYLDFHAAPIPEPATAVLLLAGVVALSLRRVARPA